MTEVGLDHLRYSSRFACGAGSSVTDLMSPAGEVSGLRNVCVSLPLGASWGHYPGFSHRIRKEESRNSHPVDTLFIFPCKSCSVTCD